MIAFDLGGPEMIILLVLVLVLFGGSQLPKLAKNLGKAQKEFKDGLADGQRDAASATPSTKTVDVRSTEITDGN